MARQTLRIHAGHVHTRLRRWRGRRFASACMCTWTHTRRDTAFLWACVSGQRMQTCSSTR
eukprot:337482-Chlamydomonas_euryale.AAC.4